MAEYPTVTISADEYFDLRSRAETNLFGYAECSHNWLIKQLSIQ